MNPKPKRSVALVRVSSGEQRDAGFSPDAQRNLLVRYAEQAGIEITKIFMIAETASKPQQRTIFQSMMKYIRLHRINVLLVEKVDRLTRNFKDIVMMDGWLAENDERQIHFVKDSLIIHAKSTSQENLNWGMRVVLAKNIIDNLKEETAKGVKEKLAQGGYPGRPTIGYVNVTVDRRRVIAVDERKGPLVRRLFRMMLDPAMTVAEATYRMQRLGLTSSFGRPLGKSQVAEILRNPFYIGKMRWGGRIYRGGHTPIIDHELFQAVQEILNTKGSPKGRTHHPLFQGLVRCAECQRLISWELHKGRYYGRCHGAKPCLNTSMVREDRLESQVMAVLDLQICPWPAVVDWAIGEGKRAQDDLRQAIQATKRSLQRQYDDVERRAGILYEDRLSGRISAERYDVMSTTLEDQREALAMELRSRDDHWIALASHNLRFLTLSQKVSQIYAVGSQEQRRLILHEFFAEMDLENRKLRYKWTKAAEAIAKTVQDHPTNEKFELAYNALGEPKVGSLETLKTIWYHLTSDLRTFRGEYNEACDEHVQNLLEVNTRETPVDVGQKDAA